MSAADISIVSRSPAETLSVGKRIGRVLAPGHVIALIGPLGAGKTVFVKGLAAGAGLADARMVTSPTFVLVNEYDARCHIYHVDTYRLGGPNELWALGFEEMCETGTVVVEWANKVLNVFPRDFLSIEIEPTGRTQRKFTLRSHGHRSAQLLQAAQP